jgi:hypothetical protein
VFTAEKAQEVMALIRPPFTAILLYGSHARGDASQTSDVDILQVTPVHTAPYSVGRFNITCYTLDQLLRIARRGGLFARHLVDEAQVVADPENLLNALKTAYVPVDSYAPVRDEVRACSPLLDVSEAEFSGNPDGLSSLASYLIRSYLYSLAFDRGARSFAMHHIFELLGISKASSTLSNLKDRSFAAFIDARKLFEELTATNCKRLEASLEACIVNARPNHELLITLGLRLLARGRPFTYDVLIDVEI